MGVLGFCMGGLLAYRSALRIPGLEAAVGFYGSGIARELGDPRCPTMLVFAGRDQYIPRAEVGAVVAHHPGSLVYPEAGHGFMRDGSDSYDPPAADDAWARMLAFLSEHLRSPATVA